MFCFFFFFLILRYTNRNKIIVSLRVNFCILRVQSSYNINLNVSLSGLVITFVGFSFVFYGREKSTIHAKTEILGQMTKKKKKNLFVILCSQNVQVRETRTARLDSKIDVIIADCAGRTAIGRGRVFCLNVCGLIEIIVH